MPRAQLPREAYAEIRSGRISVREAKKKYHISQARYTRIRGNADEHAPAQTQDQPGTAAAPLQKTAPQYFLSRKEKQLLELSGHTFYKRHQIPRQFLEIYTLCAGELVENGTVVDIAYMLPPNQFRASAGKIRFVLAESEPAKTHTGKCVDCLATISNGRVPALFFQDASTCKCGATDHCVASEKCILWKNKDVPTGPPPIQPPLEIPDEIEINEVASSIENLHDDDCLGWTFRYVGLVGAMAKNCPCKRDTCIWRRLAGQDLCKKVGLEPPSTPLGRKPKIQRADLPNTSTPRGGLELGKTPPYTAWKKAAHLSEGTYLCKNFSVGRNKGKNRLLLLLSDPNNATTTPVYGYRIQETTRLLGGIERLRMLDQPFLCKLGKVCKSPISEKMDDREVSFVLPNWKEMSIEDLLHYAETTPKLAKYETTDPPPDYIDGSEISPELEYICWGYAEAPKGKSGYLFYVDTEEGLLPVYSKALWEQVRLDEDTKIFQCTFGEKPTYSYPTETIEYGM